MKTNKLKLIVARSHTCPMLYTVKLHVFSSNFHWVCGLCVSFVIGENESSGSDFTASFFVDQVSSLPNVLWMTIQVSQWKVS